MKGDGERGRQIFFEAGGGLCRQCHIVNGQGEDFGPELSHIASKYTRAQLMEQILEPSKTIDPKYVTYLVKMADGNDLVGFVLDRDQKEMVVKDAQKQVRRVAMDQVKRVVPQT